MPTKANPLLLFAVITPKQKLFSALMTILILFNKILQFSFPIIYFSSEQIIIKILLYKFL
jgi:hypothetical protein